MTDVSETCAVVVYRVKVSCITSVGGSKLWLIPELTLVWVLESVLPVTVQPDLSYGLWRDERTWQPTRRDWLPKQLFSKKQLNTDFVRQNIHSNTDSNTQTNVNSGPVRTATIPYIKGTSETITRILQQSYNICVAHKPITTLQRLLTNVNDRQTRGPIGSSIQDQMVRLPGYLHWWNRQKL